MTTVALETPGGSTLVTIEIDPENVTVGEPGTKTLVRDNDGAEIVSVASVGPPGPQGPPGVGTPGADGSAGPAGADAVVTSFDSTPTWRSAVSMQNAQSASGVNGQMWLYPIVIPTRLRLTGLGLHVWTAGAVDATAHAVLYDDTGDFYAGNLVASSGALAAITSGTKGGSFSEVILEPGTYWQGAALFGSSTIPNLMRAVDGTINWSSMPHGTGATPSIAQGNDGVASGYVNGLSAPPAVFAGTHSTHSNAPRHRHWVAMKVARY